MNCVVCGRACGPLNGATKSWKCAGIYAHRQRVGAVAEMREELRRRFGSVEKAAARNVMREDVAALASSPRILDLYGGGLSAEWFRSLRPDAEVVVAERDRRLWPALRQDATHNGYTAVAGDFSKAPGPFDFVYLDLCSEPVGAFEAVSRLVPLLRRPLKWSSVATYSPTDVPVGVYVTVLRQNRQGYDELRREVLTIAVRALLDAATNAPISNSTLVHSYPQAGGKGLVDLWRIGPSCVEQARRIGYRVEERENDAAYHRRELRNFYEMARDSWDNGRYRAYGVTHARGSCKCADRHYITHEELDRDRKRFSEWERSDWRAPRPVPSDLVPQAVAA